MIKIINKDTIIAFLMSNIFKMVYSSSISSLDRLFKYSEPLPNDSRITILVKSIVQPVFWILEKTAVFILHLQAKISHVFTKTHEMGSLQVTGSKSFDFQKQIPLLVNTAAALTVLYFGYSFFKAIPSLATTQSQPIIQSIFTWEGILVLYAVVITGCYFKEVENGTQRLETQLTLLEGRVTAEDKTVTDEIARLRKSNDDFRNNNEQLRKRLQEQFEGLRQELGLGSKIKDDLLEQKNNLKDDDESLPQRRSSRARSRDED